MKRFPVAAATLAALAALSGCGPKPAISETEAPVLHSAGETWREITSILGANEDRIHAGRLARSSAGGFIYDLAEVVTVISGDGLEHELTVVWDTPDTEGPEYEACASAMVRAGLWAEWSRHLLHKPRPGWSAVPPAPLFTNRLYWNDFQYLGTVVPKDRAIWRYNALSAMTVDENGTIWVLTKGPGMMRPLQPLPTPVPTKDWTQCPTVDIADGQADLAGQLKRLTVDCGNVQGIYWWRPDTLIATGWENYNADGSDNLDVIGMTGFLSGSPVFHGAWHAGPRKQLWSCDEIGGALNCVKWHPDKQFDQFHSNKVGGHCFPLPPDFVETYCPGYEAGMYRLRAAGSLGAHQGPALYVVKPNFGAAAGSSWEAKVGLCYPTGSKHWSGGWYRKAETDDEGGACEAAVWTKDGRRALLSSITVGLGPSWYGDGVNPCDPNRGYHSDPYEPRAFLFDLDEIGQVLLGNGDPWDHQHYDDAHPDFLWRTPKDGFDPNCQNPYAAALAWDAEKELLYWGQAYAYDPGKQGSDWRWGWAIHVLGVKPRGAQ